MAIMKINSFDISSVPSDVVFVLDTNVLYYVHSGYYLPHSQECIDYSNVIQIILNAGRKIQISSLSVQELLFGIENKEYKQYCTNNSLNPRTFSKKNFRADNIQRLAVKLKLKTVLAELALYTIDDGNIKSASINNFVNDFDVHLMDPIDYALTENYDIAKTIFVTADRDFFSINKLNILTA